MTRKKGTGQNQERASDRSACVVDTCKLLVGAEMEFGETAKERSDEKSKMKSILSAAKGERDSLKSRVSDASSKSSTSTEEIDECKGLRIQKFSAEKPIETDTVNNDKRAPAYLLDAKMESASILKKKMEDTRVQVAQDFFNACGGDGNKERLILDLACKVLGKNLATKAFDQVRESRDKNKHLTSDGNRSSKRKRDSAFDANFPRKKERSYDHYVQSDHGIASLKSISSMSTIIESPYEENESAEVGERMFDAFKFLLEPKASLGRRGVEPSDEAKKVFGASLAKSLALANSKIALSGMVYASEWRDGKIREMQCGFIPKPMLLLCLQEQRFARVGNARVLERIVIELGLCAMVKDAMKEWGLTSKYPPLASFSGPSIFLKMKANCQRCIIFIARAYRCMKALKWNSVDDSVMRKVEACLSIMVTNTQSKFVPASVVQPPSSRMEQFLLQRPPNQSESDDDSSIESWGSTPGGPPFSGLSSNRMNRRIQQVRSSIDKDSAVIQRQPFVPPRSMGKLHVTQTHRPFTEKRPRLAGATTKFGKIDSSWYPIDPSERVLNPTEIEISWLVEESMYSLRSSEIQWSFVWKYASPWLKLELRKIGDGDGNQLEKLIRSNDGLVKKRFAVVRREITKKLHGGFLRTRMRNVIPKLREASRPILGSPQNGA